MMKHRADIDGLRALAVLPVLFFHAGVPGFSGGFIGVDVFFVISGFLITRIIADELAEERFSILRFYERRARRIFPALFVMLAVTMVCAVLLYLPSELRSFAKTMAGALLFVSNIVFYSQAGYFGAAAETMPLLHTWSLAVEEQFYLFFPVIMILIYRFARSRRDALILAMVVVSLVASVVLTRLAPGFAFYMVPTRAWELLAGSMLALGMVPELRAGRVREVLAGAGAAGILLPVVFLTEASSFPGFNAIPPVLGTAMLLHLAPGTWVGRQLSRSGPVFVGLISYSLYIWHWPLIVFTRELQGEGAFTLATTAALIATSFLLAWLSWRYVEQPFRSRIRFSRGRIFGGSAVTATALLAVAVAFWGSNGWPARFAPEVARLDSYAGSISPRRAACHAADGKEIAPDRSCSLGAAVPARIAVWGDSHGVELSYALSEALAKRGEALREITNSACSPGLVADDANTAGGCAAANRAALAFLKTSPEIDTVILAAFTDRDHAPRRLRELRETAFALHEAGKRVVIVGPIPANTESVPQMLARRAAWQLPLETAGVSRADFLSRTPARQVLAGEPGGIVVVFPDTLLCPADHCQVIAGGEPLYFDRHHLSLPGARLLVPMVLDALGSVQSRPAPRNVAARDLHA